MTPTLSICIPTFNMGRHLEGALRQFALQIAACPSPESIEICVSDNASEDDTEQIVRSLAACAGVPIRYRRQPVNLGPDANYMDVVALAQGVFCWLFGADDLPTPGALGRILTLIRDRPFDIALHERIECDVELNPTNASSRIVQVSEPTRFDTASVEQLRAYFDRSANIGALFSYLSSIVVRRETWNSSPLDPRFIGSGYSHAQRLCLALAKGAIIVATPERNVYCRLGNDSFLERGPADRHAKRTLLDIAGYARIAREVFRDDWRARQVLAVLRRTHPHPFAVTIALREVLSRADFRESRSLIGDYAGGQTAVTLACIKVAAARAKRSIVRRLRRAGGARHF